MASVAQVEQGFLKGALTRSGVVFRGVPYAKAVRFGPATVPEPWAGTRDASADGVVAPQLRSRLAPVMGEMDAPQAEDCQFLTIWTTGCDRPLKPVLLFFHGGAYVTGAGSQPCYDGEALAARGEMVVVCANFRLGALGYLPGACPETVEPALTDQHMAVEWVFKNIQAFGGDPSQITLMGQSAGAMSIAHAMLHEPVAEKVSRLILQSGAFSRPVLTRSTAKRVKRDFLLNLGIDPDDDCGTVLNSVSTRQILEAQVKTLQAWNGALVFRPAVADAMNNEAFLTAFAKACEGKEVLIGVTAEEGKAFFRTDDGCDVELLARKLDTEVSEGTYEAYAAVFPELSPAEVAALAMTDHSYARGTFQLSALLAAQATTCYAYVFDWAPANAPLGACHCIELPFVFDSVETMRDVGMLRGADPSEMRTITSDVQQEWIHFVHAGRPADTAWAPFDPQACNARRFGLHGHEVDPGLVRRWLSQSSGVV